MHNRAAWTMVMCLGMFQAGAAFAAEKLELADFEQGTSAFELKGAQVVDSAELGSKAARLDSGGSLVYWKPGSDWSAYNTVGLDVFVLGEAPATLYLCFKDDSEPHGYFSWINRYITLPPGRRTLGFDFAELQRGEGSPKDMLDTRPFHWNAVERFFITAQTGTLLVDNIRLEKVETKTVEGLWAFDFGPEGAPTFPGFKPVSPQTDDNDASGLGWSRKGTLWARTRIHPPDTLVGDWVSADNATFSVKVPNGSYRVWLMWEDPGEWEFYQSYAYRRLRAEGRQVLEETMDGKEFLDRYFHFAETEDFPGEDIWTKYIGWRYQPREFEVPVSDGRLDLTLEGSGQYAATLNALVIWPVAKEAEARKLLEDVARRRREAFSASWVEAVPKREVLEPKLAEGHRDAGFLLYRRPWSSDINLYDAPGPAELLQSVDIQAARGEYEPITFAVYALRDLEGLSLQPGPFTGPDGAALPADAFDCRYVRYKFNRIGFAGAGQYGVLPALLARADTVSAKAGTSRRFWVTVHVPTDQPAGLYRGDILLTGTGVPPTRVPVSIRVLPFALPEPDLGVGMFQMGDTAPASSYGFPEAQSFIDRERPALLRAAREHGFTYIPSGGFQFERWSGQAPIYNLEGAVRSYQLLKSLGFTFIDCEVSGQFYQQVLDDDGALAREHGFAGADDLVKAVFGGCISAARSAGLPAPVWCFADEPPETQAPTIYRLHQRMRDLAGARSDIAFSVAGENQAKLLDVTSICDLNVVTIDDIKRALQAGNTVYLNNQGRNRWAYGLYLWKAHQAGVSAYSQFTWMAVGADPYYPLDTFEGEAISVYPNREGEIRSTPGLERVREGIDDYRYVLALSRAAEKAGERGAAAKKLLADTFAAIRFEDTRRDRQPQMTQEELDAFRHRVAEELARLTD
jgi:hypothetical protein